MNEGYDYDDYSEQDEEDVYSHMTLREIEFNERMDEARRCHENGDWRDPGEIRAGA